MPAVQVRPLQECKIVAYWIVGHFLEIKNIENVNIFKFGECCSCYTQWTETLSLKMFFV